MTESSLAHAHRLLAEAIDTLAAAGGPAATGDELLSVLTMCEGATRRLDQLSVATVSAVARRGVLAERGCPNLAVGLSELLGWDRSQARARLTAAEQVDERVGLDGQVLPARLAATAAVFATGQTSLRHVEAITRALGSPAAGRLAPHQRAGAEAELAAKASLYTPTELAAHAAALIELLDEDGAEPDDRDPPQVNELHLTRQRGGTGGGNLVGRFDDAAMFDAIATVLDAHATPRTAEDHRTLPQRHGEALAEVCGYVLDHGAQLPETGARRPHLNVVIRLEDLENRARTAVLDFGGTLTPTALRHLACDAAVIPIVLNGAGQPLDVGRATRTIPDGLRRAVTARDRGCAHPGCDRPPSWSELHHILPWEHGGETKLDNCVMLCRLHHRQIHSSSWTVRIRYGLPEFVPPAWVDVEQKPRRKPLHHLLAGG